MDDGRYDFSSFRPPSSVPRLLPVLNGNIEPLPVPGSRQFLPVRTYEHIHTYFERERMTTKSKVAYLSKYTTLSSSAAGHHDDDENELECSVDGQTYSEPQLTRTCLMVVLLLWELLWELFDLIGGASGPIISNSNAIIGYYCMLTTTTQQAQRSQIQTNLKSVKTKTQKNNII